MRLAEHVTALRAWCKECLPGRRKPDVLRHGIVGAIYGHTTTAMMISSTPPPALRYLCSACSLVGQAQITLRNPTPSNCAQCRQCTDMSDSLADPPPSIATNTTQKNPAALLPCCPVLHQTPQRAFRPGRYVCWPPAVGYLGAPGEK